MSAGRAVHPIGMEPVHMAAVFAGEPDGCDFCGRPMDDELFFADAALPGRNGRWGFLCRLCTLSHGVKAGWGRAQFYERTRTTDPWISVAGMAPAGDRHQHPLAF